MSLIQDLIADLHAERAALDTIVLPLSSSQWSIQTPARGWDVQDQIWHLAWYEGEAHRAIAEPSVYAEESARALEDTAGYARAVEEDGRRRAPQAVLEEWHRQTALFQAAALAAGAGARVPWFDTQMSVTSLVTARIMETWAHGQDIRDALGLPAEVSDRLRHIAHLACHALPYSFRAHGRELPTAPVRVELHLPSGDRFRAGPDDAPDRVIGSALDFCLVATQRRHVDDVALVVTGATAVAWIQVAQSFAGPPGRGRAAGEFTRAHVPDVRDDA